MSLEGQRLGEKYRIIRLVGEGGMGSVYEAEHLLLGTRVAIKVLHTELARRPGLTDRFLQEARVAAQIRSPHVVQVHDMDRTADGTAFLVMELLAGSPLSRVLEREQKLPEDRAILYSLQILEALVAAHGLGVIHRDLKPENVFVTLSAGKPLLKLIDFGIAKLKTTSGKNLTAAGAIMGTAEYMAPEQAFSASEVDVRADLYSVGVILYEMLAGRRPVTGNDPRVLALQVDRGEVTPLIHAAPGVRPELAGLVHKAMAPRPELRFANAAEMRIALETVGKKVGVIGGTTAPIAEVPFATGKLPEQSRVEAPRKTGTQMEAPLASAFIGGAPAPMPPIDPNAGRSTMMAPLVPPAAGSGPAPYVAPASRMPAPNPAPTAPAPRRVWPWIVVPLAIGAGVGATLVLTDVDPFGDDPPPAPLVTATPSAAKSVVVLPTAATTVAPLGPATPPTPPTAPTGPRPTPAEPAVTITPIPTPPALSGYVLPSALPTAFPSDFPLPFPIPTTPQTQSPPAPIPTPTPR